MANRESWKDAQRPTRAKFISGTTAGTVDIRVDSYDAESGEVFYTELDTGRQGAASERDIVPMEGNWSWNGRGFVEARATPAATAPSLPEIVRKYHAGGYKDRQEALYALADYFETQGHSEIEALSVANAKFGDIFGNEGPSSQRAEADAALERARAKAAGGAGGGGAGAGDGGAGAGGGGTGFGTKLSDWWGQLGESQEGRQDLLGEAIRSQYPSASNIYQQYLNKQLGPLTAQYGLQRGFGPRGGGAGANTFRDFVRTGTENFYSPAEMQNLLEQTGGLLGLPNTKGLSEQLAQWREYMKEPVNQFNTAFESSIGNVADVFRPSFRTAARNAFSDYGVNIPGGQDWLQSWLAQNKRFF